MELQAMHKDGKLDKEFSRLYFSPTRPMFELYDLKNDPYEMNNLIGQEKTLALERQLKGELQRWMIMERDFVPLPVPPPGK
jgi:arylsulfatase A-like enzyme